MPMAMPVSLGCTYVTGHPPPSLLFKVNMIRGADPPLTHPPHMLQPWHLSFSGLLVAAAAVYCQSADIDNIRYCGKRDLCSGHSPQFLLPPEQINSTLFPDSHCFCDGRCAEFADCCKDFATFPPPQSLRPSTCIPLSFDKGVYGIPECTSGDVELQQMCRGAVSPDQHHYTLDVAVFSRKSGHFYANVYCALCHDQLPSALEPVRLSLLCTQPNITLTQLLKEGKYLKNERGWRLGDGEKRLCTLVVEDTKRGRRCVPSVAGCPPTSDPLLSSKCLAYQLLVKDGKSGQVYKNPHCALCHGLQRTDLRCFHGLVWRGHASLHIIMDFDWDISLCDMPLSVWDGLQRRCIQLEPPLDNTTLRTAHLPPEEGPLLTEGYLTTISLAVSILCLLLHFLVSYSLPGPHNLPTKILNSLSWSLIIAQLLFIIGLDPLIQVPHYICQTLAILIHFFFLCCFFWMNVMSIDIWQTFSNIFHKKNVYRRLTKYSMYAWGSSFALTGLGVVADRTSLLPARFRPLYAGSPAVCWFGSRFGMALYFFLPVCLLLSANLLLFSSTVYWFHQNTASSSRVDHASGRREYIRLWLYVKLSTLMGLSWLFGMGSSFTNSPSVRYLFILLNGLQGAFIFLMFDLKTDAIHNFLEHVGIKKVGTSFGEDHHHGKGQSSRLSSISSKNGSKVTMLTEP